MDLIIEAWKMEMRIDGDADQWRCGSMEMRINGDADR